MSFATNNLRGDILGGLASAIVGLVHALTFGLLAFAALGPESADLGIRAGFAAAIVGNLAATFAGSSPIPAYGPRVAVSLVLAGLVATLAADSSLTPTTIYAYVALAVALMGLAQIAFGALGLASLVKFVPYPVVAGFMCGIAALILLSQAPAFFGVAPGAALGRLPGWVTSVQPLTVVVGAITIAAIGFASRHWKSVPAGFFGLVIGTAAYFALHGLAPNAPIGPVVGPVPSGLPGPAALLGLPALAAAPHFAKYWPIVGTSALVMAVIGSLDAMLSAMAIDAIANGRTRSNRELIGQGIGNVVSAACGGVPLVLAATRASPAWRAGGRTRLVGYIASAWLALAFFLGASLIALVPLVVLAGIMFTVAAGLVDNWTRGLLNRLRIHGRRTDREAVWSLAIVILVAAVAVAAGLALAVALGIAVSMALLVVAMNRSLLRRIVDGRAYPSRRIYGVEVAQRLVELRSRMRIVDLEGALFFGSAERLGAAVEQLSVTVRFVILDLRRVTTIDATGAVMLEQLAKRIAPRHCTLLLAGVTPDNRHGRAFEAYGVFRAPSERQWFADADQAIEWAERGLLGPAQPEEDSEIPPRRFALMRDLDDGEAARVGQALARREVPADGVLFRHGEPGDCVYLLAQGAMSMVVAGENGQDRRIVTFAPGSIFGETSILDGAARSATAIAAEHSVVYGLSREALAHIEAAHPALANKLLRNLGRHLAGRLRMTTDLVVRLEDSLG